MYDRKTWIVVGACALLLAINFHYGNKRAAADREARAAARQEAAAKAPAPGDEAPAPDKPGTLEVTDPAPSEVIEPTLFTLETDKAVFTLTSLGGGVKSAVLKEFESIKDASRQVTINEGDSDPVGTLSQGPDGLEHLDYKYIEKDSEPGKRVVFAARHPAGLIVKKTWSLVPADEPGAPYLLDFQLAVENSRESAQKVPLENFSIYLGRAFPLHHGETSLTPSRFFWRSDGGFEAVKSSKFKGGMFSDDRPMIVESFEKAEYTGISNQFFATVLRPAEVVNGSIWAKPVQVTVPDGKPGEKGVGVRAGASLPAITLEPGSNRTFSYRLFMGPKENRMLSDMGEGWGDIINYGWAIIGVFSWILNWALVHIHDLVARFSGPWSWGIAIIVVTLVVRTLMWPLYARSNRTMKRMSKLKPEMDKLKEKYPDDPAKMQQEVMGLYRKYGINPLGGCLPMLAQMPIFFGFYRMLQYAVELRGHGFLWVDDLSMPDTIGTIAGFPINILPIIMGVSSFAQMAMMPTATADKTQATIMKLMPIMFLVFCYNFAAALALYWTVSNLFSIAQTWITQRMPEPELKERKGPPKKSFMERMAEAAEQQQKMKQARGRVVEDDKDKPKKPRGPRTGG